MTDTLDRIHPDLRSLALPIDSLHEDPRNANDHNAASHKAIAASFIEFGQRKPIVVRREGMVVEAGNGTLAALRAAGWTHLACVVCDDDEARAIAYGLADNQAAKHATWNFGQLRENVEATLAGYGEVLGELWAGNQLADILAGQGAQLNASIDANRERVKAIPHLAAGPGADDESEDYEELSAKGDGTNRPRATAPLLHWGKRKIYITEDEATALEQSYQDHVERMGTPYGFITMLLEKD